MVAALPWAFSVAAWFMLAVSAAGLIALRDSPPLPTRLDIEPEPALFTVASSDGALWLVRSRNVVRLDASLASRVSPWDQPPAPLRAILGAACVDGRALLFARAQSYVPWLLTLRDSAVALWRVDEDALFSQTWDGKHIPFHRSSESRVHCGSSARDAWVPVVEEAARLRVGPRVFATARRGSTEMVAHALEGDRWIAISALGDQAFVFNDDGARLDAGEPALVRVTRLPLAAWIAIMTAIYALSLVMPMLVWRRRRARMKRLLRGTLRLASGAQLRGETLLEGALVVDGEALELAPGLRRADPPIRAIVDGDRCVVLGAVEDDPGEGPFRTSGRRRIVPIGGEYAIVLSGAALVTRSDWRILLLSMIPLLLAFGVVVSLTF